MNSPKIYLFIVVCSTSQITPSVHPPALHCKQRSPHTTISIRSCQKILVRTPCPTTEVIVDCRSICSTPEETFIQEESLVVNIKTQQRDDYEVQKFPEGEADHVHL